MSSDAVIQIAIFALGLCILGYYLFVRVRREQMKLYEHNCQAFFEALRPLEKDDGTPLPVLELMLFLNDKINQKQEAWLILKSIKRLKKQRTDADEVDSADLASDLKVFSERRPELYRSLVAAMTHAIFAISYLNAIAGPLVRRSVSERAFQSEMNTPRFVSNLQRLEPRWFGGSSIAPAHAA